MPAITHPACVITWHQAGDRTGHCSACHRTFVGVTAFDRHRASTETGRVCLDPKDIFNEAGLFAFESRTDREGAEVWALTSTSTNPWATTFEESA